MSDFSNPVSRAGQEREAAGSEPGTSGLVLLEFAGLGREQTFAVALPDRPEESTLVLDPLDEGRTGRFPTIAQRAGELAAEVRGQGFDRVLIAASCSAARLAVALRGALLDGGTQVAGTAVIGPVLVTPEIVGETVEDLIANLGGQDPRVEELPPLLAAAGAEAAGLELARRLLTAAIERYIELQECDEDEILLLKEDVLERYLDWVSFLIASIARHPEPADGVDLLAGRDGRILTGLTAGFPGARLHPHQLTAEAELLDESVGASLRELLAGRGWAVPAR